MLLIFNRTVDRGGYGGETFICSNLLSFVSASTSKCKWKSDSILEIFFNGDANIVPGSYIWLKSGTVKESCSPATDCNHGAYAEMDRIEVRDIGTIQAPVVVLSGPEILGDCANLTIDLSRSYGSGCRDWASITTNVSSDMEIPLTALKDILDAYSDEKALVINIPRQVLLTGLNYTFVISVCNFFKSCSTASLDVSVVDEVLPVLTVYGGMRQVVIVSSRVDILASVYIPSCGFVSQDIDAKWDVFSKNGELLPISSLSKNPYSFKTEGYTFVANESYEIRFTVFSKSNNMRLLSEKSSVSATVQLQVQSTDQISAVITGGHEQSIYADERKIIDASTSCDHDFVDCSLILVKFTWSCVLYRGGAMELCNLPEYNETENSNLVIPPSLFFSNDVLLIKLLVSKEIGDRIILDEAVTLLRYVDEGLPLVVLSGPEALKQNAKLTISSEIRASRGFFSARWYGKQNEISGSLLDLASLSSSRSASSFTVSEEEAILYSPLIIPARTLLSGAKYTFTLECQLKDGRSVSTSIIVEVASAPIPGYFRVSPSDGKALDSLFSFSASHWESDAFPLSFVFGVVVSGQNIALSRRTIVSQLFSKLAAGIPSEGYLVNATLAVYDNFDSVSHAWTQIVVTPASPAIALETIKSITSLTASVRNTEEINGGIMIVTSLLNNDFCLLAPNCSNLNRHVCTTVLNTCGPCVTGYYADNENTYGNSTCILPADSQLPCEIFNYTPSLQKCNSSNSCPVWELCESGDCVRPIKSCLNNCSNHGKCRYYKAESPFSLYSSPCYAGSLDCISRCECDVGFLGSTCADTATDLMTKRKYRFLTLELLYNVTTLSDLDSSVIIDTSAILLSLSSLVDELSIESVFVVNKILKLLFSEIQKMNVEISAITESILSTIDLSSRALGSTDTAYSLLTEQLDEYAYVAIRQADILENSINEVRTTFALTVGSALWYSGNSNMTTQNTTEVQIAPPVHKSMCLKSRVSSKVTFPFETNFFSDDVRLSVSTIYTALFSYLESDADITKVSFSVGGGEFTDERRLKGTTNESLALSFELPNTDVITYVNSTLNPSFLYTFRTSCGYRENNTYNYTCPNSGFIINHHCKSPGTLVTKCPNQRAISYPACAGWNGTHSIETGCVLLSYTSTNTECWCPFRPYDAEEISAQWNSLSILTATEFLFEIEDFPHTSFLPVEHVYSTLSAAELATSPVLIILYYVFSLCFLLLCFQRFFSNGRTHVDEMISIAKSVGNRAFAERITENRMHEWENFSKHGYWRALVAALWDDLLLNHRWLRILYSDHPASISQFHFNVSDRNIVLLLGNLLTAAVVVIVMSSIVEVDDYYCEQFSEFDACLHQRRYFVDFERRCRWDSKGLCYPEGYEKSPFTVLFTTVISHFLIYFASGSLSMLIKYTLALPTSNSHCIQPSGSPEELTNHIGSSLSDNFAARVSAGVHLENLKLKVQSVLSDIKNEDEKLRFKRVWGSGSYCTPPTLRNDPIHFFSSLFDKSLDIKLSALFYDDLERSFLLSRLYEKKLAAFRTWSGILQRNHPVFESMGDARVVQLLSLDLLPLKEGKILSAKFERNETEWIFADRKLIYLARGLAVFYFCAAITGIGVFVSYRHGPVLDLWFYATVMYIFIDCFFVQLNLVLFRDTLSIFLIFSALTKVRTAIIDAILYLDDNSIQSLHANSDIPSIYRYEKNEEFAARLGRDEVDSNQERPVELVAGISNKEALGVIEKAFRVNTDPDEALRAPFLSSARLAVAFKETKSRSLDLVHKFSSLIPRHHVYDSIALMSERGLNVHETPLKESRITLKGVCLSFALSTLSLFAYFSIPVQDIIGECLISLVLFIIFLFHLELYRTSSDLVYVPIVTIVGICVVCCSYIIIKYVILKNKRVWSQRNQVGPDSNREKTECMNDSRLIHKPIDSEEIATNSDFCGEVDHDSLFGDSSCEDPSKNLLRHGLNGDFDCEVSDEDFVQRFTELSILDDGDLVSENIGDLVTFTTESPVILLNEIDNDSCSLREHMLNDDMQSEDLDNLGIPELNSEYSSFSFQALNLDSDANNPAELVDSDNYDILNRVKMLEELSLLAGIDNMKPVLSLENDLAGNSFELASEHSNFVTSFNELVLRESSSSGYVSPSVSESGSVCSHKSRSSDEADSAMDLEKPDLSRIMVTDGFFSDIPDEESTTSEISKLLNEAVMPDQEDHDLVRGEYVTEVYSTSVNSEEQSSNACDDDIDLSSSEAWDSEVDIFFPSDSDIESYPSESEDNILKSFDELFGEMNDAAPHEMNHIVLNSGRAIFGELDDLFLETKDEIPEYFKGELSGDEIVQSEMDKVISNTELYKKPFTDKSVDVAAAVGSDTGLPHLSGASSKNRAAAIRSFHEIEINMSSKEKMKKRVDEFDVEGADTKANKELDGIKLSHHRHEAGRKTEIKHAKLAARATLENRLKKKKEKRVRRSSKMKNIGEKTEFKNRRSSKRRPSWQLSSNELVDSGIEKDIGTCDPAKSDFPVRLAVECEKIKNANESPFQKAIIDHAKTTAMLEEELKQKKLLAKRYLQARRRAKVTYGGGDAMKKQEYTVEESMPVSTVTKLQRKPKILQESLATTGVSPRVPLQEDSPQFAEEPSADMKRDIGESHIIGDTALGKTADTVNTVPSTGLSDAEENSLKGTPNVEVPPVPLQEDSPQLVEEPSADMKRDIALGKTDDTLTSRGFSDASKDMYTNKLTEGYDLEQQEEEDDGAFRFEYFQRVADLSTSRGQKAERQIIGSTDSVLSYDNRTAIKEKSSSFVDMNHNEVVEWGTWSSDSSADIFDQHESPARNSTSFEADRSPVMVKPSFIDWGTVDEVAEQADVESGILIATKNSDSDEVIWGELSSGESEDDIEIEDV